MFLYNHKGFNNLLKRTTKGAFHDNELDSVVSVSYSNCTVNSITVDANRPRCCDYFALVLS